METRWIYTTSKDFPALREASKNTCLIPIGAVEKHGLHLPVGTDMLDASEIARRASQEETVAVTPDFWFGDVPGPQPAGSMTFRTDLVIDLLENLCDQIGDQGFTKIVLCNGHGGNSTWIHLFMRRLENKKKPYAVIRYDYIYPALDLMPKMLLEQGREAFPELTDSDCEYLLACYHAKMREGHACLAETAHVMGFLPECVHLEYLGEESGKSTKAAVYLRERNLQLVDNGWEIHYPNFYDGDDPVGCTHTIGKASLRLATEHMAKMIKLVKEDENILKWHRERIAKLK